MSLESRAVLKTYFETNDFPTQAQFIDLIDSLLNITDDAVLVGGEDNIEAFNGGGQANATQLTKANNNIDTQTNPGDSVKLPTGKAGMVCTVGNNSGGAIDLFPAVGGFIYPNAINIAESINDGSTAILGCVADDKWVYLVN